MDYIEKAVANISVQPLDSVDETRSVEIKHVGYSQTRKISVPDEVLHENGILTPQSSNAVLEAYKVLRARILKRMEQNNWQTLSVTSPRQGEGKTLTTINLGVSIALKTDTTVLLVDLDFRRPSLHKYLGFEPEFGVTDYLTGDIPLHKAFVNPGIERLVILPQRHRVSSESELLASQKMTDLVHELKRRYRSRIIIFDMPPAFIGDDVLTFSNLADAVLLVVEDAKTKIDDVQLVYQHLEEANIIGTILNKSKDSADSYDYGY